MLQRQIERVSDSKLSVRCLNQRSSSQDTTMLYMCSTYDVIVCLMSLLAYCSRARVNGNVRGEGSVTRFDVLQDANCSLSCVLSMISDKQSSVNTISPSHVLLQNANQIIYQQHSSLSILYLTSADLVSGTLYIPVCMDLLPPKRFKNTLFCRKQ